MFVFAIGALRVALSAIVAEVTRDGSSRDREAIHEITTRKLFAAQHHDNLLKHSQTLLHHCYESLLQVCYFFY